MKKHVRRWSLSALVLALVAGCGDEYDPGAARSGEPAPAAASQAYEDPADTSVRRLALTTSLEYDDDADRVRLYALVRDQDAEPLYFLTPGSFSVTLHPANAPALLDAESVTMSMASSADRVVALVIDSSGSMQGTISGGTKQRIELAKEAAALFVSLMEPGDLTAVVDFDDEARVVQQLTADQAALGAKINAFTADGATNLGGALIEAVRAVGTRPGKRAVVLLTDGDDTVDAVAGGPAVWRNDPNSTRYQGLELAIENGLVVYTVGLGSDLSEMGLGDLETFAAETGGKFFQAITADDLLTAFGSTVPLELDGLPPLTTYQLEFDNPVHHPAGLAMDVAVRLTAAYKNAWGTHWAVFDGTYTVEE